MAIFHLDVKTGTRGGGQSASAKFDYLGREGRYCEGRRRTGIQRDPATCQLGRKTIPRSYWQAADEHERSNGRLYQQVEVALPVELDERQRRDLARSFAEKLTKARSGFPIRSPSTGAGQRGAIPTCIW